MKTIEVELCLYTRTAAVAVKLLFKTMKSVKITDAGYGMVHFKLPQPNLLRWLRCKLGITCKYLL